MATDAELRDQAVAELKLTTVGYISTKTCKHTWTTPPAGSHWANALDLLAQIGAVEPPPPPPPPPPTGTRPFLDTSALNKPIPSGTPNHPDSATMITGNVNWVLPSSSAYKEWVGPRPRYVYVKVPDFGAVPTVTVHVNYSDTLGMHIDAAIVQCPLPSTLIQAFNTTSGLNHDHVAYICDDAGNAWEFYHLTAPGTALMDPASGTNQWNCLRADYYPTLEVTGVGYPNKGGSASKISGGLGLLRPEDFPVGYDPTVPIPHALRINGDLEPPRTGSPHPNFVAPASSADYNGPFPDARAIPVGARIRLDPSIDVANWPSVTAKPEPWRSALSKILLTLQVYGIILVDNSGAQGAGGIESTNTVGNGTYRFPWETGGQGWAYSNGIPYDLMSHFQVVDWTKWTGV